MNQEDPTIQITRDLMAAVAKDKYEIPLAEELAQKEHNLYEVTQPGKLRVYGDIDLYASSKLNARTMDCIISRTLKKLFKGMGEKYCLMTATGSDHKNKHKGAVKVSWRFVLPNLYGTQKDVKKLVMSRIEPTFRRMLAEEWGTVIDTDELLCDPSVYSKNQKMRMVNSSKPNENRPLVITEGTIRDSFITYIPDSCRLLNDLVTLDPDSEPEDPKDVVIETKPLTEKGWKECQMFGELIPLKYLDNYSDWCRFVWIYWGLEQSQRMLELINEVSKRSSKYGGIQPIIKLVKDFKGAKMTMGTIKFWCKGLYKTQSETYIDELFDCHLEFRDPIYYESKYVKPLIEAVESNRTVILKSHLGTGKTVAIMGRDRRAHV